MTSRRNGFANSSAQTSGVSVSGVFGIRISNATAIIQPHVESDIGAVTINAGRNISVSSSFNRTPGGFISGAANSKASSSGGSLGVTGGGADAESTAGATVIAHAGGPDGSLTA